MLFSSSRSYLAQNIVMIYYNLKYHHLLLLLFCILEDTTGINIVCIRERTGYIITGFLICGLNSRRGEILRRKWNMFLDLFEIITDINIVLWKKKKKIHFIYKEYLFNLYLKITIIYWKYCDRWHNNIVFVVGTAFWNIEKQTQVVNIINMIIVFLLLFVNHMSILCMRISVKLYKYIIPVVLW